MSFRVPFVNPRQHYVSLRQEFDAAIHDCLENGDLIMRRHLREYEKQLGAYVGTGHAVGLNSGYHALHLSLLGAGIGPGDEVITVAHTFVATISAIVHVGARPVLVDVGKDYNMDVDKLPAAVTRKTKAILPVHLNGRVCAMDKVMAVALAHRLVVIEDAAQALGARYRGRMAGAFGLAGCFSHYPFKILGTFGDGGSITTNDAGLARKATLLRYNGEDRETGEYHYHGYTCLLDNVWAAVLSVKLKYFNGWVERRRQLAARYQRGLRDIAGLQLPHFPGEEFYDTYQNYVIRARNRDELARHLREHAVETLIHWRKPVWEHKGLALEAAPLPETVAICKETLSLPMNTELTDDDVDYVVAQIQSFYS